MLRRIARPLLAGIFISGGVDQLLRPEPKAESAQPVLDKAAPALDQAAQKLPVAVPGPSDANTWVQVDGAVKVGSGLLLALGRAPAALAASLVPTTLAEHRFWEMQDKNERTAQQIHFFKNCSMLGGLLLAVADTEGKPSVGWWGRRAARTAKRAARTAKRAKRRG